MRYASIVYIVFASASPPTLGDCTAPAAASGAIRRAAQRSRSCGRRHVRQVVQRVMEADRLEVRRLEAHSGRSAGTAPDCPCRPATKRPILRASAKVAAAFGAGEGVAWGQNGACSPAQRQRARWFASHLSSSSWSASSVLSSCPTSSSDACRLKSAMARRRSSKSTGLRAALAAHHHSLRGDLIGHREASRSRRLQDLLLQRPLQLPHRADLQAGRVQLVVSCLHSVGVGCARTPSGARSSRRRLGWCHAGWPVAGTRKICGPVRNMAGCCSGGGPAAFTEMPLFTM